ncbi:MAG TPA: hypothetical protein VIU13_02925 [Chryseolinea sp.]
MSAISEKCYSAGWMGDSEYVLWDAVISGPRSFGCGKITQEDIDKLIGISNKTKTWIVFDDELEETAIPVDKWRKQFTEDTLKNPGKLQW